MYVTAPPPIPCYNFFSGEVSQLGKKRQLPIETARRHQRVQGSCRRGNLYSRPCEVSQKIRLINAEDG
jgi:hypothetical protein